MKLSAAIMAHPVREAFVSELVNSLDRPVQVAWDNAGPPSRDPTQRWATGRRAWLSYDPEADWHLVLQDDAVVCGDLLAGLERLLKVLPGEGVVSPYIGRQRPNSANVIQLIKRARDLDASWIEMYGLNWGVAIALPVEEISDMLAWGDRQHTSYDTRISQYARIVLGWPTWCPWPSLVDHRDGPSLVGHSTGRSAHEIITGSALDLPATDIVARDRRVDRLRSRREEMMMASYAELRQRVEALEKMSRRLDAVEEENANLRRDVTSLKRELSKLKKGESDTDKES